MPFIPCVSGARSWTWPRPSHRCTPRVGDAVKAYDVDSNTWTAKARLPSRLQQANQAVELNGKIYVSGGFTRFWDAKQGVWRKTSVKTMYVYDVAKNTWQRKADMPVTTVLGVAGAYKGTLYVAAQCYDAAYCGESLAAAVWRYLPSSNIWTLVGRSPTEAFGHVRSRPRTRRPSGHSLVRRGARAVSHRRMVAVKPMSRLPGEQSARSPART
jgi:hypothetical protein